MSVPAWMPVAQSYMGVKEIKGAKHNPVIVEFFERAGHPEVKDDETAWCSAFVNAVMHEAGYEGTNSLLARSWLKWGKALKKPKYGCIVVFKRGNSSWQGHVGFFVREEGDYVYVLGGNQNNSVNISRYHKGSLLGYRWPSTLKSSRTVAASISAAANSAAAEVVQQVAPDPLPKTEILDTVQQVQQQVSTLPFSVAQVIFTVLAIVSIGLIIYFRWDDIRNKGR